MQKAFTSSFIKFIFLVAFTTSLHLAGAAHAASHGESATGGGATAHAHIPSSDWGFALGSPTPKRRGVGRLEVIVGPMFAGKTTELLRRLERHVIAKRNVLTIKHKIDDRYAAGHAHDCVISHKGEARPAAPIDSSNVKTILTLVTEGEIEVIGFDEIQFFPEDIIVIIRTLLKAGKHVIVAGLDCDFRAEPFGKVVPYLLSIADSIDKLTAICNVCCAEAQCSQRLIDGKPAAYDSPTILVGAAESYEPRCRRCFVMDYPSGE